MGHSWGSCRRIDAEIYRFWEVINMTEKHCDLTIKQRIFVQEYLIDLNATKAAIRSGYAASSARQVGSENLSKPYIQAAIADAMAARNERLNFDSDMILQRLVQIDQMDLADVFTSSGHLKPLAEWPLVWRQSIAEMDVIERYKSGEILTVKRLRLPDKLRNLELIGRHCRVGAWNV